MEKVISNTPPYADLPLISSHIVSMVDNVKQGIGLATAAVSLMRGGFSMNKVNEAKQLLAGAQSFFGGLKYRGGPAPTAANGLGEENFVEDWANERKDVWMFSGACIPP